MAARNPIDVVRINGIQVVFYANCKTGVYTIVADGEVIYETTDSNEAAQQFSTLRR